MRISINKLKKLRAGQGVWRVLIHVGKDDKLEGTVGFAQGQGRRRLHWFDKGEPGQRSSMYFIDRTPWRRRHADHLIYFLSDMHGHGAFTSRRSAQRYVDDVLAGLYPQVERDIREWDRLDKAFAYSCDYDDDLHDNQLS